MTTTLQTPQDTVITIWVGNYRRDLQECFGAEDALVKPQIISGTHAITLCLLGVLRPGDELLSVTGTPYDTLKEVLYGDNCGSLKDFHIKYSEVDLIDGKPDYKTIEKNK